MSPHLAPQKSEPPPSHLVEMNDKLNKLLKEITNRSDITQEMKSEAKALLNNNQGNVRSPSASPNAPSEHDEQKMGHPRHEKSDSMVIHDHAFHQGSMLNLGLDDHDHHEHSDEDQDM